MNVNPIMDGLKTTKPSTVTKEMLEEAAERYNRLDWVKQAGRHYFVGRQVKGDGTFVHYLDCTGGVK